MRVRTRGAGRIWVGGLGALAALTLRVPAGQAPGDGSAAPPHTLRVVGVQKAAAEPPAAAAVSAAEVLKLAEAGVSPEVIRSFIENAPSAISPSAADVIALKEHGLADEVTLALIKRSTETRAASNASAAEVSRFLGQLRAPNGGDHGPPDPESYEYFQHYYLFPRTLSSVYDRLYFGTPPSFRPYPLPPFGW